MHKLIVAAETSIDGKISNPQLWERIFAFHANDVQNHLSKLLFEPDALIMGRKTYESFAAHWPAQKGVNADKINALPKYVASTSLNGTLSWNAKLFSNDIVSEIKHLKKKHVLFQYGIGTFTQFLIEHKLVDEIRLLIFPITIAGDDKGYTHLGDLKLELLSSQEFSSGAIAVNYKVL